MPLRVAVASVARVIDAAAEAARRRVAGEGAVGDRPQAAAVSDAAAASVKFASAGHGVVGKGAVGDRQRADISDAAAAVRAPSCRKRCCW